MEWLLIAVAMTTAGAPSVTMERFATKFECALAGAALTAVASRVSTPEKWVLVSTECIDVRPLPPKVVE